MATIITRASKGSPLSWSEADANFTNLNTDKAENSVVALKAPLASPDLTGVPTAPTATNGTNTTQLATTAFVQAKTASQTPSTAVGNIAATTVQAALEELDTEKASLTGATFSGQVTATKLQTGVSGTNTNNFILDASAADGTMKLERGDGQDIMTVDAAGKVEFPQGTYVIPAGTIIDFAGTSAPTGFLACPNVPTNVSRTTYAALFAAIGTSWGVGDGSTTFGIPFFEDGLPALRGTPGAKYAGSVQAHIHLINQPNGATSVGGVVYGNPGATGNTNSTSGDNMPAGRGVLKCVKV